VNLFVCPEVLAFYYNYKLIASKWYVFDGFHYIVNFLCVSSKPKLELHLQLRVDVHLHSCATKLFTWKGNRRMWGRFLSHTFVIFNIFLFWGRELFCGTDFACSWSNWLKSLSYMFWLTNCCLNIGTWIRGRCWLQFLGGVFLVLYCRCFRGAGIKCSYSFV